MKYASKASPGLNNIPTLLKNSIIRNPIFGETEDLEILGFFFFLILLGTNERVNANS